MKRYALLMKPKQIAAVVLGGISLGVFWPWLGNPFNYRHLKDSVRTSIPIALAFGEPCATYANGVIYYDHGPNCFRFRNPRRFKGIWLYEFEGSTFLENATSIPTKRPAYDSTAWLMYNPEAIDPKPRYDGNAPGQECFAIHAFQIEFIGQLSPEGHGHMGLFGSEIWVRRMLSAKPLPPPNCATY
jgi:hypothetical protein